MSERMDSGAERVNQEVVSFEPNLIGNSNQNNSVSKVSEPKISEEDKELQRMATTVEAGVRQDMVGGKSYMCVIQIH